MEDQGASSSQTAPRSSGKWTTEYVVLLHIHDPAQEEQQKHSKYCGAFREEIHAVNHVKRLVAQDPRLARSHIEFVDLTSQLTPQKPYKNITRFLADKEALDLIYSGGQYIGLGYHYREEKNGKERMFWIQESRAIAY